MTFDDRVIDLIAQLATVKRADIQPQHRLRDDLGLDSVSSMELLSLLAEELQLDIPIEEATAVTTVADALAMAQRHAPAHETR
jgi:acyl carrier protein